MRADIDQLDETNSTFHQPARDQTLLPKPFRRAAFEPKARASHFPREIQHVMAIAFRRGLE
jgi:hypothetical protein